MAKTPNLTDRQKKNIVALYVNGESMRSIASKYKVAPSTIKRVIDRSEDAKQLATLKKEENTQDMLAFLDTQQDKAKKVVETYLDAMLNPEMVKKASPNQLSTALGTVIDKFTMNVGSENEKKTVEKVADILVSVRKTAEANKDD